MTASDFWRDTEKATKITREADTLKKEIEFWDNFDKQITDLADLVNLAKDDFTLEADLARQLSDLEKDFEEVELETLFTGKYDGADAVLAIHAGAGGTDAQDWTEMLLRMYLRYVEAKGWKAEMLTKSEGSEAGIKSVMLEVKGYHAYGYLKNEAGVHRLVRLSPFNPAKTRETSFALVEVLPEIPHKELEIDEKDIKIETSTARGHGGQSVNTTYSAVRLTHLPTGITVSIQSERSQHQNRERALEVLRARLAKLEEERRAEERKELRGEFRSAEWGNQIRSYVLHPYKLVKDHRTNEETSNIDEVLDGNIDRFIERALERR